MYVAIHPGDPPWAHDITIQPFVGDGGACDYFDRAVCAPPLVCTAALTCRDACGDATVDPGEECDDGGRSSGDGCAADCRLEVQPLDGVGCEPPTPLVFVPGADGRLIALAEGDTSLGETRDESCLLPGEASPTLYVSLDVPVGARAGLSVLGEEGMAPNARRVTAPCGAMFSCTGGAGAGGTTYVTTAGPGLNTFAISGGRGPEDRGRVLVRAALCLDGRVDCDP